MDQTVRVLGVPMDLGADRRGVDMGPSAIRYAGLAEELEAVGTTCVDGGDIAVPRPEERDPDTEPFEHGRAKYFRETREVCEDVATAVSATVADGEFPLVLGGDHSIAIGTAAGATNGRDTGIVWFDAHGDFNTPETTPSGNVHGMSLAAILGKGPFAEVPWAHSPRVREENVALVGTRALDERERDLVADSDVSVYTMTDIDERGITDIVREALDVATAGVSQVHVSLDMDCLDPDEAPGVGTPVRGGITYREAHAAMELVHEHAGPRLSSFELVEVNPILDQHNRTAELACELTASAFGKSVL
ncbi:MULTISPECIES: arginase [Salinibaculum]|uniref:arginase n=1 Tax=Salinibaculum TaxID=2732368 RepID=UPI0030D051A0